MKKRAILALAISLAVFMVFSAGFAPYSATSMKTVSNIEFVDNMNVASEAAIWTDKPDYLPGEIVTIFGSGFLTDSTIEINVTRPDATIDSDTATADGTGYFVHYYDLNGIIGQYNVTATDGTNFAETTFIDGLHVDFSQYANIADEWTGAILGSSNSLYYEGMSVPQRIAFVDIYATTGDVHTLTFSHMATKGGIHSYDWLTGWNQGNEPPLDFIPWAEEIGPHVTPQICEDLYNSEYFIYVDVPDDSFVSMSYEGSGSYQERINAYEIINGNRRIKISGNAEITSASFTSFSHNPLSDDTSDSDIEYELTWVSASDQILIQMGGHLAVSGSPTSNPVAWGTGLGASVISGGSYHFKLKQLDCYSLGSQDNQIKGEAIEPAEADLGIVKTGPAAAEVGDEITYEFEVTNYGPSDALNVIATDNLLGSIMLSGLTDEDGDGVADDLAFGAIATGTATHIIPIPGNDPIVDTVLVESSTLDSNTENNQDSHQVDVLRTGVSIQKIGPTSAEVGELITYTITVTNTGEVDLYIISLYDDLLGDLAGFISDGVITLLEGSETFDVTYTVESNDPDPLPNEVTVHVENKFECDPKTDSASWEVDILHPVISLTKTATDGFGFEIFDAYIGDTITYVFKIENTGDTDLTDVILTDNTGICDDTLTRGSDEVGDNDDILEPGEIWIYTCTHVVTLNDPDPLPNVASVEGTYAPDKTVYDTDDATVDILHYAGTLYIDKTGPAEVNHGETVFYYVYVWYTSPDGSPAQNVLVTDSQYTLTFDASSDDNSNGLLDIGEIWIYYVEMTIGGHVDGEEDPITNTATASGEDLDGDPVGPVSDSVSTNILHYEGTLHIDKYGPAKVYHGDSATYTVEVWYTSPDGSPAQGVVVTDDHYTLTFMSGDLDLDNLLDVGEVWIYQATQTIGGHVDGEEDPITNTATVIGQDLDGDELAQAQDSCTTDILHHEGALTVVKTGPVAAFHGDPVMYTIYVTYSSSDGSPATNVQVVDDHYGLASYVSGDADGDGYLDVIETWVFQVYDSIADIHDYEEEDPIVNTVTAYGQDLDGDDVAEAQDSWTTDILHREGTLTVVKTGPETAYHGDLVTYYVAVTYSSDDGSPAQNIVVTDDKYVTVARVDIGIDDDGDLLLEPGEIWYYEVSGTIGAHIEGEDDPIVNTATATGQDLDGDAATPGSDTWTTDILHREGILTVVKTGPETAYHGASVTYEVAVTYTSLDMSPAQNIVVTDDEYATVIRVRIGDNDDGDAFLEFGEIWYYTVSGTIGVHDNDEEDPIVNIATATGQDLDDDEVTPGFDDHSTDILHTEGTLTIVKTGPKAAYHGDSVTYYVDVTYWSSDGSPAVDIHLADDHYTMIIFIGGDADGDGYLDVDETWLYEVSGTIASMHVDGEEDPVVNIATATGKDLDGDVVTPGSDDHSTNILHHEGILTVMKTGPYLVYHGDSATYTVEVSYWSPDNSPAQGVEVIDDHYALVFIGGDFDLDNLLDVGEVWIYEVTVTIGVHDDDEEDPITNVATVTGWDLDGDVLSPEVGIWTTDILHYDGTLHIDKYGPETAYHGDSVTYTIVVWYTSPDNSPALQVSVLDDPYGTATYVSGDADGDGYLDADETWIFEVSGTIEAHVDGEEDPITDTAIVSGLNFDGHPLSPSLDSWTTDILHREGTLTVVKTGPETAYHGDSVTYYVEVTYSSDDGSPAQNIVVTDDKYSMVTRVRIGEEDDGDAFLEDGEIWYYEVSGYIPAHTEPEEDPIVNTATATGQDLDGDAVTPGSDSWTTDILHKEGTLTVLKIGPTTVYHGDMTFYDFIVTYTSLDGSPATNIVIFDNHYAPVIFNGGDTDGDGKLDVTETWFYSVYVFIPLYHSDGEEDPIVNTATVTGEDLDGDPVTQGQNSWITDILHREGSLAVVKTGPDTAYHGDSVTYTIYVTYSSPDNSPAIGVSVFDDHYGLATYVSGDLDGDNELDVTETWIYTVSGNIAALHADGEEDPITNTATATGQDLDGDLVTQGQNSWITDILHREGTLWVEKTGPLTAYHEDLVLCTIYVTYTSFDGSPAKNVDVIDDKYGMALYMSGDADGDDELDVTETWIYWASGPIPFIHIDGEEDPITNTATATGEDLDGDNVTPGQGSWSIDILHREGVFYLMKTGPLTAYHGDFVTYTIEVDYISYDNSPARNVHVWDDHYGYATYVSGDIDGDGNLDVGETWIFEVSGTIETHVDGEEDPIVNTATVSGMDLDGDIVCPVSDTFTTNILHREGTLTVVKTGPETAYHDDLVTYIIEVTYSSSDGSPATNVLVFDDQYGSAIYMSGDADGDDELDVTETWVFQVSDTIPAHDDGEEDPVVNTATATGQDLDGDAVTPGSDTWSTDILHYAGTLHIDKYGSTEVYHGDTVTYTVEVWYTSPDNSPAQNVIVTDDHYTLTFMSGDLDSDNLLDVGEVWMYEATVTIGAHDDLEEDPIINTATVSGKDLDGDSIDPESDTFTANILHHEGILTVVKTGPYMVYHGDSATYTVEVSYWSLDNSPAQGVVVADDHYTLVYVGGDLDLDNLLDVGEIWVYQATVTIGVHDDDEEDPIVNIATATGQDLDGDPVGPVTDSVSTDILHPAIAVEKTAAVTLTFEDLLYHQDVLDHYLGVTFSSGTICLIWPDYNYVGYPLHSGTHVLDSIATGYTRIDFDFTVSMVGAWFCTGGSTVYLYAYDASDTLLASTSVNTPYGTNQYVELSASGIKYVVFEDSADHWGLDDLTYVPESLSWMEAQVGETINYLYFVTNTGDCDLFDVSLVDDVFGSIPLTGLADLDGDGAVDDLAEGATAVGEYIYVINPLSPEYADPLFNTATAEGYDTLALRVEDQDTMTVDVLRTGVSIEKTGPEWSEIGATITYTITVINTGEVDLYITSLSDSLLGDVIGYYVSGDIDSDNRIDVGETWIFEVPYLVDVSDVDDETDPDTITNLVTVIVENAFGADEKTTGDDHTVKIFRVNISAYKLEDVLGDGSVLSPIEGWTIFLFRDGHLYSTKTTDSDGAVYWIDLGPGEYVVEEFVPTEGWTPTSATDHNFGIVENGQCYEFTFKNFKWFDVTGQKWEDLNGDGLWNSGELPLADWTITLYRVTDLDVSLYDFTETDSEGYYSFTIKDGGLYRVMETLQTRWTQTYPIYQIGLNSEAIEPEGHEFIAESGMILPVMDFRNFEWFTVSGYKYEYLEGFTDSFDQLDFEIWNPTEGDTSWSLTPEGWLYCHPTISFPRILANPTMSYTDYAFEADARLLNGQGYALIFRANNLNDFYSFQYDPGWGLRLRLIHYDIFPWSEKELAPAVPYPIDYEWHHLKVIVKSNHIMCYIDGHLVFDVTDTIDPVNLIGGVGFRTWGSEAYFDNVCVLPIMEPLDEWTIKLYRDSPLGPVLYDTAVTGDGDWPTGYYMFTVEEPGTYRVVEVLKDGWTAIKPVFHIPSAADEEVVGYSFDAISGLNFECCRFWNFRWAEVIVYKYDTDDNLLDGWTIHLRGEEGQPDMSDVTVGGQVTFIVKWPGDYYVEEDIQSGWTIVDPLTNRYDLTATSGSSQSFTFVNFKWFDVSGYKWNDLNGNGIWDAEEPRLNGWIIYLFRGSTSTNPADAYATTTTAYDSTHGDGYYKFTITELGNYFIREQIQPQWTKTYPVLQEIGDDSSPIVSTYGYDFNTAGLWSNAGFEKGYLANWNVDSSPDFVGVVSADSYTAPYEGNYMLQLGNAGEFQPMGPNQVSRIFIATQPTLTLVYNIFTYDYEGYNNFHYQLTRVSDGYVIAYYSQGAWGWDVNLKSTGWQHVSIDISAYIGQQLKLEIACGGTWDTAYPTWVYVDGSFSFGNFEWFDISGHKWSDLNGDGCWDAEESGLNGWTIYLFKDSPSTNPADAYATTTTAYDLTHGDGYYMFTIKEGGNYFIREVIQPAWTKTWPLLEEIGHETDDLVCLYGYDFTAASGLDDLEVLAGNDFGNFQWVKLIGYKWHDRDGDAIWDKPDEPGLNGWTIYLYEDDLFDTPEEFITETHDGLDGYYEFTIKRRADYYIREDLPARWTKTYPAPEEVGGDTLDVISTYGYDLENFEGLLAKLDIYDFGNFQWVIISGYKFNDLDGDTGWNELTEPGLNGWTIYLYEGDLSDTPEVFITETHDGLDGYYEFTIKRNAYYYIREALPSSWTKMYPAPVEIGPGPGGISADGWDLTNFNYLVAMPEGYLFGNFHWFTVTVYKYEDVTGDGYTKCEDTPLEGWMFQLDGIEFGPTDETGCAMAIVKLPGHYVVTEILKTGWTQTGIPSYEFNAVSGLDRGPYIFTNFKHFTITGYKYEYFEGFSDKFNEPDFPAWLKSVGDYSWSLTPEGWLYCDGSLEWARIFAGPTMSYEDYVFEVDVQLIRDSGWEVFFRSNGLEGDAFASYSLQYEAHCCATLRLLKYVGTTWIELDSIEFPPDYDWHHIKVTVNEGRIRIHIDSVLMFDHTDVEFYPEGGIGLGIMGDARAYFDNVRVLPIINSLGGWTINLYKEGILYATTTTDADGFYSFIDLGPGHYMIAEILQPGWSAILPVLHVPDGVGEEVSGHSFDGMSGKHIGCKDFWNFKWFYVSGFKWHDVNGDGVGDVGLSGWNMYLFKDNPSTYQEYAYASTTTIAGGYYEFAIKEPGTYFIREILKMGWTMTFPATQVGSETEDLVSTSGYDGIIAVSGMNDILDRDFCNFEWFVVSGHKWNDLNGDGIWQKEEEPPMTCWVVYLFDHYPIIGPEEAIAWTHTGCEDGYYEFLIKEAGSYYIKEELKPGWTKTAPGDLEIGDETTPIISEGGYEFTVDDLVANPELLTDNDFGNFEWAEVIVYKYDTDDNLLNGWIIHLCGEDGQPDMSDVTVGGQVTFTVKWPGDYYVQEVLKAEWTLISPLTNRHDITVTSGGSLGPYVFVNFKWAEIIVYKQDTDLNPLGGWTINLFGPDAQIGVTGADGYVTFTVTQPGSYYVQEVLQTGWTLIDPLTNRYDLEVHTGGSYSGYVFTNFKWADIIVYKQDTDLKPLDGWTINLFGPDAQSAATGADGYVTFTVTQPGSYYVQEVLQTGWTLISPLSNRFDIEVHTGGSYNGYVFTNFEWAYITVCKQDTDLNPLGGWTINLFGPDAQSGVTGADGCVTFTIHQPGDYYVQEVLQTGWTLISPLSNSYNIEVHTGETYGPYVFVNFEWADIIVYKQDTDGNPLEGWTFNLFGPDGQSGITGADGYVTFTVTQPGPYYVQEVSQAEWTLIDPVSNRYDTEVYTGETYGPYVFVNFEWIKISGYKYEDRDGNHESTDYPLGGWTILLYKNSGGDPLEAITGDGSAWPLGYYEFIVKEPGGYAIKEFLQEGWVETWPITAYTPGPQLGYDFEPAISGQDWENRNFWNSGARTYITDTSDCRTIVTEFRLVVTPDFSEGEEHYKIASTNPGGFYFNIIFHAWTDGVIEIHYDLGYGFIEHGGQPIHAYVWTDLDSDGVVDWCDGEVTCIDKKKIVSVDYENGIIVFDGLEECNDILVTIHMKFDKKSFQNLEKDWIEDNLLGRDYEFSAFVEGCWSSTTVLTEISKDIKKMKACAVFGVVLEEAEHDEPVSGAIFRLYKDGKLLKARTTGEDGIFYFDKLDDGTYYLDIELPLGLILQDSEYDDTVIYLSIQIKLQDGDFISIGVFIKTGASEPDSEPPDVSTTMEQIWIPSASSDSTYTSDPTNRASRDRFDGVENIPAMVASSLFIGIAIAAAWFGSVVSLAFVYNTRTRRRAIQAAISRPTRYGMQWSIEDSDSE